jgi:hypothetical protein
MPPFARAGAAAGECSSREDARPRIGRRRGRPRRRGGDGRKARRLGPRRRIKGREVGRSLTASARR